MKKKFHFYRNQHFFFHPQQLMNRKPNAFNKQSSDSRLEILVQENSSLTNTMKMVTEAQEQALATTQRMAQQMSILEGANQKMTTILTSVPYLGDMASKIQIKRKRDRLILGGLIGFLMFFCVWYLFG